MVSVVLDNLAAGEPIEKIMRGYGLDRDDINASPFMPRSWLAGGLSRRARGTARDMLFEVDENLDIKDTPMIIKPPPTLNRHWLRRRAIGERPQNSSPWTVYGSASLAERPAHTRQGNRKRSQTSSGDISAFCIAVNMSRWSKDVGRQ